MFASRRPAGAQASSDGEFDDKRQPGYLFDAALQPSFVNFPGIRLAFDLVIDLSEVAK